MRVRVPATYLRISTIVLLLSMVFSVYGQERCGTVEHNRSLKGAEKIDQFEEWLSRKKTSQRKSLEKRQQQESHYTIPVVVHIIHNGEPVGEGANIPTEQVLSQIKVLNNDFKRLNADAVNTPAEFVSVAGSMDIEFVLAKQDPEGLATDGIVRVNGGRASWTSNDNYQLKSKSYWNSDNYLNIWVCNITDFLGYTQFPVSDLPGLENSSNNAETDGIVVSHLAFGSSDDGDFQLEPDYNKGRTLTHEMGHFFGLRHIWGDDSGSCGGTDYVDDTPNQAGSTNSCPTHPVKDNCVDQKMFQNFLDYTDDECMNLFTAGQIERMDFVINNSPRRTSLLTSPGSREPDPLPNDMGVRSVISPLAVTCDNIVTPIAEVRNYGSNTATSVRVTLSVNESEVEAKVFSLDNLGFLDTASITFAPVALTAGTNFLTFQVTHVNGVSDTNANNNYFSSTVYVPQSIGIPFTENFDTLPSDWTLENPDQQITWQLKAAPSSSSNKALYLNFYEYEDSYGEVDVFLSPVFDLSDQTSASLSFDVAYTQFQGSNDRLRIVVLTDCESLDEGTIVYEKAGPALATVSSTSQAFTPNSGQWRKEFVPLNQFIGHTHVQVAFVGINDWGNNLYVDNISINILPIEDIVLRDLLKPGPVTCDGGTPTILVENFGTTHITNFTIQYSLNGADLQNVLISDVDFPVNTTMSFALPSVAFQQGVNKLYVNLIQPNGNDDSTPSDNAREFTIIFNDASDIVPLRQNFEQPYTDDWIVVNRLNPEGMIWQNASTNFGTSLIFNSFNNTIIGDEAWLVSPVLDFSGTSSVSLTFDVSYAKRIGKEYDSLKLLISKDCGNSYLPLTKISLFGFSNQDIAWVPDSTEDWKRNFFIDLDSLAGQENIRLAFVAVNANGNNLFLDNIEFYSTDVPAEDLERSYAIYGYTAKGILQSDLKVSFNLAERQDVHYSIVDTMGKLLIDGRLSNVLNQTYPLDISNLSTGVYIVRWKIGDRYFADRILVAR